MSKKSKKSEGIGYVPGDNEESSPRSVSDQSKKSEEAAVALVGAKKSKAKSAISSGTDDDEEYKPQKTTGIGAMIGSGSGLILGVVAGMATGPLAFLGVPLFAWAGYHAGAKIGDTVEDIALNNHIKDRLSAFISNVMKNPMQAIGIGVGALVGLGMAALCGPAFPVLAPFFVTYGAVCGSSIGEVASKFWSRSDQEQDKQTSRERSNKQSDSRSQSRTHKKTPDQRKGVKAAVSDDELHPSSTPRAQNRRNSSRPL